MKYVSNHKEMQNVCSNIKRYGRDFYSFEAVDRGSETQLQMGETLNSLRWYWKG